MILVSSLAGLAALGAVALASAAASATPFTVPGQASQASNFEQTDYVCNEWGHCWHWRRWHHWHQWYTRKGASDPFLFRSDRPQSRPPSRTRDHCESEKVSVRVALGVDPMTALYSICMMTVLQ
jgi:hypothetical protein